MSEAYDRAKLIALFGDDPETLAEIERDFLDTAYEAAREIAGTDDLDVITRAAHRLKGASAMIGADALRQVAEAIERAAKADDLPGVRYMHDVFRDEVHRVAVQAGSTSR